MKEQLNCPCPENKMMPIEYGYPHPESYDGISEITCTECKKRVGRWSGRVLTGDDYENRFGRV